MQITNTVSSQCINNFLGSYPGLTIQKLLKPQYQNFLGIPVFAKTINHLIMSRTGTPTGPLFIGVGNQDGTGDGVMIADDDEALAHTYCERGVSVQFNTYSGQDHDNAAIPFEAGALSFLTTRLSWRPRPQRLQLDRGGQLAGSRPGPRTIPGRGDAPQADPQAQAPLPRRPAPPARRGHPVVDHHRHPHQADGPAASRRASRADTVRLARVGTRKRRVVLRVKGKMPKPGRYTVLVARGGKTLARHAFRLR